MKDIATLNKNRDFNRLYSRGKSYVTSSLVLYVLKNRQKKVRIGITTSKKIGNAVQRNRARRVIRESCRKIISNVKPGYDIVLVARKKTSQVKCDVVLKSLTKMLGEAIFFVGSIFNGMVYLFRLCMLVRPADILWSVKNTIG